MSDLGGRLGLSLRSIPGLLLSGKPPACVGRVLETELSLQWTRLVRPGTTWNSRGRNELLSKEMPWCISFPFRLGCRLEIQFVSPDVQTMYTLEAKGRLALFARSHRPGLVYADPACASRPGCFLPNRGYQLA